MSDFNPTLPEPFPAVSQTQNTTPPTQTPPTTQQSNITTQQQSAGQLQPPPPAATGEHIVIREKTHEFFSNSCLIYVIKIPYVELLTKYS